MFFRLLSGLVLGSLFFSQAYAEPANLGLLQKEIVVYHDSGEYEKELSAVLSRAKKFMHEQIKANKKEKLAVVLDIDETSLSNYPNMAAHNFHADKKQIHEHIMKADAPVIKPMLEFYEEALRHQVAVFFVTGRPLNELSATETNLLRAGYKNWAGLYLRPEDYKKPSIVPFKSEIRKSITEKGYTVIATIGDQDSDLAGGYAKKGFKLPNPYYFLP